MHQVPDFEERAAKLAESTPSSVLRGIRNEDQRTFNRCLTVTLAAAFVVAIIGMVVVKVHFPGVHTVVLWLAGVATLIAAIIPIVAPLLIFTANRKVRQGLLPFGVAERALEIQDEYPEDPQ
jgi:hypothetical protein